MCRTGNFGPLPENSSSNSVCWQVLTSKWRSIYFDFKRSDLAKLLCSRTTFAYQNCPVHLKLDTRYSYLIEGVEAFFVRSFSFHIFDLIMAYSGWIEAISICLCSCKLPLTWLIFSAYVPSSDAILPTRFLENPNFLQNFNNNLETFIVGKNFMAIGNFLHQQVVTNWIFVTNISPLKEGGLK